MKGNDLEKMVMPLNEEETREFLELQRGMRDGVVGEYEVKEWLAVKMEEKNGLEEGDIDPHSIVLERTEVKTHEEMVGELKELIGKMRETVEKELQEDLQEPLCDHPECNEARRKMDGVIRKIVEETERQKKERPELADLFNEEMPEVEGVPAVVGKYAGRYVKHGH